MAYETGRRIVDMAYEDLRPSKILTRDVVPQRDPPHHRDRRLDQRPAAHRRHGPPCRRRDRPADWMAHGYDLPLLVNMQPAGKYLSERFHRAGGVPAVLWELLQAGKLDGGALTVTGRTLAENLAGREADRPRRDPALSPRRSRNAPASSSSRAICSTSRS